MKTKNDFEILPETKAEVEGKPRPAGDYLPDYYKTLGKGKAELLGIKTGFDKLDRATLGLDGLIVLGGMPGAGKTSLALQLAFSASDLGTPTLFYSLEMPRRAILTKILNRLTHIRYTDLLLKGGDPQLLSDKQNELTTGKKLLEAIGKKFYIRSRESQEAEINFEIVEQEINFVKAGHKAERVFVAIDHLQVFDPGQARDQLDKENKLITGFKGISERTGATILLISQKSKMGFKQKDMMGIKGSVDIVYLADVVMTLESDSEQLGETPGGADYDAIINVFGGGQVKPLDLLIVKNRYNAPGLIKLDFLGEYSEFKERTKE